MMQTLPALYRWTRAEYDHLALLGAFEGKAVELIKGQIVTMSPKGPRHETIAELLRGALAATFPAGHTYVRKEAPLALGESDEPEPDAAVVLGQPRDYQHHHPTASQTLLVVEVADTTRLYDLGPKADLYAAAGIADYWVVDLSAAAIVVCRRPTPDPDSSTGYRYADRQTLTTPATLTPLAAPAHPIAAADLLP